MRGWHGSMRNVKSGTVEKRCDFVSCFGSRNRIDCRRHSGMVRVARYSVGFASPLALFLRSDHVMPFPTAKP